MKFWPIAQEANHLIEEFSQNEAGVELIDLAPELLGQDGKPSRHLYRFDGIHPNASGYAIWTNVIKTRLEQDLNN
jgi:lysophospholipase L1-like esterase